MSQERQAWTRLLRAPVKDVGFILRAVVSHHGI